jgi:hyaluronoglucosaminidase
LSRAVDRNVATAYTAGKAPAEGDALVISLSTPRAVDQLTILQPDGSAAPGRLEVKTAAGWQQAGQIQSAYSAVTIPVTTVEAIRISWTAGAVPPRVHEVILRRN